MSKYYITLPGDKNPKKGKVEILTSVNELGESSFKTFYPEAGYVALQKIIAKHPNVLPLVKIHDDFNVNYSVEEFLDMLKSLKIVEY